MGPKQPRRAPTSGDVVVRLASRLDRARALLAIILRASGLAIDKYRGKGRHTDGKHENYSTSELSSFFIVFPLPLRRPRQPVKTNGKRSVRRRGETGGSGQRGAAPSRGDTGELTQTLGCPLR